MISQNGVETCAIILLADKVTSNIVYTCMYSYLSTERLVSPDNQFCCCCCRCFSLPHFPSQHLSLHHSLYIITASLFAFSPSSCPCSSLTDTVPWYHFAPGITFPYSSRAWRRASAAEMKVQWGSLPYL